MVYYGPQVGVGLTPTTVWRVSNPGARQELQGKAAGMEASPEPSAMKAEPSPEKSQALQALQKELGQIAKLLKQNDPLEYPQADIGFILASYHRKGSAR